MTNGKQLEAKLEVTPEGLELLKKHEIQHKFSVHIQQELNNLLNEKATRSFQKNIINQAGDQLIDVNWQIQDMSCHFRGKYKNLIKILEGAIERTAFNVKPKKAQLRQSQELEQRIMKEFKDKGQVRKDVNPKELPLAQKTK